MAEIDPNLSQEEFMSPQGCGAGTDNACFALTLGETGMRCMVAAKDEMANMAGIQLGWRMNIAAEDGLPWCPKGVIQASKKLDDYSVSAS